MKKCQKCGTFSSDDALFCGSCGNKFPKNHIKDNSDINILVWKMDIDWEHYIYSDLPVVLTYHNWYQNTPWEELNKMCLLKDPAALLEKGIRLLEEDPNQAASYFEQVLKMQKNTTALFYMGQICLNEFNSSECEKYFRLGSTLGDADCSYKMGNLYRNGDYVEMDPDRAIQYYELSERQGRKDALVSAGEVCLDKYDDKKALEYFTTAYESVQDPVAAFYIGRMYYYGTGVEESDSKAFPYLKFASDHDVKDANAILGSLYGYGQGTNKDVDLAMKLLDDVTERDRAISYYAKGTIMLREGNNEEGRLWLQKSAELGNESAQKLLDRGAGKTDQERAEEGLDPYAMIRYSSQLLGNGGHSPDLSKAREIMTRAKELYPDNMDVRKQYIRLLNIVGHVDLKIGASDTAFELFSQCIREIDALNAKNIDLSDLHNIETGLYMECGEAAYNINKTDEALRMFARTDHNKYPYAVVLSSSIHIDNREAYGRDLAYDAKFLNQALNSNQWREPFELATAYYMLAAIYSQGVPRYINPDVNYAYSCIQKCAEIDPELAENELGKYSRNIFGQVIYKS